MMKHVKTLLFCVALTFCATNTYALNIPFFGSPVARAYNAALEKESEEIRQEIFALLGVEMNKAEWEEYKKNVARTDAQEIDKLISQTLQESLDPAPLSADIRKIAATLLKEQKLSATKVACMHPKGQNPATAVGQSTHKAHILISEKIFNTLFPTQESKEGVLLHEIMHLKNNDCLEQCCLLALIAAHSEHLSEKDAEKLKALVLKKSRLCEKRADIQAALTGVQRAHALHEWNEKERKTTYADEDESKHPSHATRADYLKKLVADMQQEEKMGIFSKLKAALGFAAQQPVTI